MQDGITVFRYVLLRQLLSPVTWLVLGGGLMVANSLTFFIGDLLSSNNANMNIFWNYSPFVLAVMVPLLTMRGWAYEQQMGTKDWLTTKPISPFWADAALVESHGMLLIIWLLASLTLPLTLGLLASPDWALIFSGYLGLLLLGYLFISIGFLFSCLAKNMLTAFVGGFLGIVTVLFSAVEGVSTLLPVAIPASISDLIISLSPVHIFERLYGGFIVVADILWMFVLAMVFFTIGHLIRRRQSAFHKVRKNAALGITTILVIGLTASFIFPQAYDLTQDNRYKPSLSALEVVKDLPVEEIEIDIYFSSSSRELSAEQRIYGRQITYYLKALEELSDKVTVKTYDPSHSPVVEMTAREIGVEANVTPNGSRVYMGIVIKSRGQKVVISDLPLARRNIFEFDLMNNIVRFRHKNTRRIAVLTGMNMSDDKQRPKFLDLLAPFYRIDVSSHRNATIPDQNDLVIVMNGYYLEENAIYALDQYVQRGGKVLAFVDPFWFASPAGSMQAPGPDDGATSKAGFDDLLAHWGMQFVPGDILADSTLGTAVQITDNAAVAKHPLWLTFSSGEIDQQNPMTRNLNKLSVAAAGVLKIIGSNNVSITPLVSSSSSARLIPRKYVYQADLETMHTFYKGEPQQYVLAADAIGEFSPFYKERPESAKKWFEKSRKDKKWPEAALSKHTVEALKAGRVITVADMDIFSPQLSAKGGMLQPSNDNLNLIFNMVRSLLDEPEALKIHLRHEATQRPFIGLEKELTKIASHFSKEEDSLVSKLMQTRRELANQRHELSRKRFVDPILTRKIEATSFRELQLMHRIDNARENAFRSARHFISGITVFNVLGGFILLLVVGWTIRFSHRRWTIKKLREFNIY